MEISFNTTRTSQRFTVKWGIKDNPEVTSVIYIARSGFTYNLCHVACRQLKTQAAFCCSLTSDVKACFYTSYPIFPDVNLWEGACSRSQQNPRAALVCECPKLCRRFCHRIPPAPHGQSRPQTLARPCKSVPRPGSTLMYQYHTVSDKNLRRGKAGYEAISIRCGTMIAYSLKN